MTEALPVVVADTSALIAFFNDTDEYHEAIRCFCADWSSRCLARQFRTDIIATLDRRHFGMIRALTRHDAFRLLRDDVPAGR